MEIYFSIGTNLGDRQTNIQKALDMLDSAIGINHDRISRIMESEAMGFIGPPFLDCVVVYRIPDCGVDSFLYSHALLRICKSIERAMGRKEILQYDSEGRRIYHDRIIDIDILFYGNNRIESKILTIPHKLISQREFIMNTLRDVVSPEIEGSFKEIFNNN